ncbi:excisionase family DNA-binding protein [Rhodopseudomonas sp. P2A-2r]|uniref:helix-turn-helix domain-containing protein n=1 Tax=Rhodopseudomonas sp. P2A-2r TaxID=2991972 RepID=UPI002233EDD4|nr:helix-turn-helix domain-containing protein [Rhodopseudomonas sp. P2A-2r]UZE46719.1 excisionase family DNA-binding protein [Rhodopseudomonas sp. P2A-2r]
MKDVLTTAEAAQMLGISTRTAQLWVETGQLSSWKTPGGHRRIPRQAVLNVKDRPVQQHFGVRAHAIIFAAEGRGAGWRHAGLRGLGLLLHISEDVQTVREWLALTPPMLIVIEGADVAERKRLVAALYNDVRLSQTTIVSLTATQSDQPVLLGPQRVQIGMSPDVSATSAAVVEHLMQTGRDEVEPSTFPKPWNERARLAAVRQSGLVGSAPDPGFDRLVRLAAYALRAPIAMFTLITEDEQWFKSRTGFEGATTPRDWAFCNETLIANELTVIEDLSKSASFSQSPTIAQPYGFRFYAGAPVRDPLGFALGSTCVIDVVPRTLSENEREALTTIADAASNLIRLRALEQEIA